MKNRHRALIQWAKARDLTLPQPFEGLIAQRRTATAQARREEYYSRKVTHVS